MALMEDPILEHQIELCLRNANSKKPSESSRLNNLPDGFAYVRPIGNCSLDKDIQIGCMSAFDGSPGIFFKSPHFVGDKEIENEILAKSENSCTVKERIGFAFNTLQTMTFTESQDMREKIPFSPTNPAIHNDIFYAQNMHKKLSFFASYKKIIFTGQTTGKIPAFETDFD